MNTQVGCAGPMISNSSLGWDSPYPSDNGRESASHYNYKEVKVLWKVMRDPRFRNIMKYKHFALEPGCLFLIEHSPMYLEFSLRYRYTVYVQTVKLLLFGGGENIDHEYYLIFGYPLRFPIKESFRCFHRKYFL